MNKLEHANSLYLQYLKEGDKTVKQVLSQKYAIEKDRVTKIKQRVKKLFQRPKTLVKSTIMSEDEFDYYSDIGLDNQRREKELLNY